MLTLLSQVQLTKGKIGVFHAFIRPWILSPAKNVPSSQDVIESRSSIPELIPTRQRKGNTLQSGVWL
jgi:hypothetical protein